MDNCTDYMELISAYADGELPEFDRQRLEAHLRVCANCTSILNAYRGISLAIDESSVPAPESLSRGVMDKIKSEDRARTFAQMKKFRRTNRIMTRYILAAACLVFLILTVPRLFGSRRGNSSFDTASAPMASLMPGSSGGSVQAPPESGAGAGSSSSASVDGGTQSQGSSSSSAPAPAPAVMPESAMDDLDTVGRNEDRADSGITGEFPLESSAPIPAPSASSAPSAQSSDAAPSPSMEPPSSAQAPSPSETQSPADAPAPMMEMNTEEEALGPGDEFDDFQEDVYAIIMITGELPELLEKYEPKDAADSGELFFEIPRAAAKALINEIGGSEGVVINIIDESAKYAWVYYTP